jgi:mono/diheme cytochrome c family protein
MNALTIRRVAGLFVVVVGLVTVAACSDPGQADPVVRGERIHKVCLSCHGTTLYVSPQREIKSLPALRQEVARWGDYYNPALTEQEIDDVTAYLNANFYKFSG